MDYDPKADERSLFLFYLFTAIGALLVYAATL